MTLTLGDLFTPEELAKAEMLYDAAHDGDKYYGKAFHVAVKEYVVRPALPRINETLKQQNDESYLSYVLEMAMTKRKQQTRRKYP